MKRKIQELASSQISVLLKNAWKAVGGKNEIDKQVSIKEVNPVALSVAKISTDVSTIAGICSKPTPNLEHQAPPPAAPAPAQPAQTPAVEKTKRAI